MEASAATTVYGFLKEQLEKDFHREESDDDKGEVNAERIRRLRL